MFSFCIQSFCINCFVALIDMHLIKLCSIYSSDMVFLMVEASSFGAHNATVATHPTGRKLKT